MPEFSVASLGHLASCDVRLHRLFNRVIRTVDCTCLEGHRGQARQEEMLRTGKSQADWPHSKHNSEPSLAVDVAPYPIDWSDRERFCLFAGFVLGVASEMGSCMIFRTFFTLSTEMCRCRVYSSSVGSRPCSCR